MRNKLKKVAALFILLVLLLGAYAYRDFTQFCDTAVPILAYHRVGTKGDLYSITPEEFQKQMEYLNSRGYKTLTLGQYADKRSKGETFHNTIVLTFDDGYSDNLTAAVPIMEKYHYVGSCFLAIKFFGWPGYLTWKEAEGLAKAGWEIGSHTYNHVELGKIEDPNVIRKELIDSKDFVRGLYNNKIGITLCYPSGSYNSKVCEIVRETSYIGAVTGRVGVNTNSTPIYELRRVNVFNNGKGIDGFIRKLDRAYLISWFEGYGIDLFSLWKKIRG